MFEVDRQTQSVRHPMVRWYEPALLLRTGLRAAIATVVGQISDNRELQAALDPLGDDPLLGAYDLGGAQSEGGFWLDYVADLGDGWDATFSVASALAEPRLQPNGLQLPRAGLLIMGGDEVYPDPSVRAYRERTIEAYRLASAGGTATEASLFALPGNHDWYDGLAAFTEVFCRARHDERPHRIGMWASRQRRSYFAIRLPQRWWLCGVDTQLQSGANATQVDYFRDIGRRLMSAGDRIILCCPRPEWVLAEWGDEPLSEGLATVVAALTGNGARIRLVMSGDLHHYSRYEQQHDQVQLVTAGGGGSFLHPTHVLPEQVGDGQRRPAATLRATYPGRRESARLARRNLAFPLLNLNFSLGIGVLYTLMAWLFEARSASLGTPMSETLIALTGPLVTLPEAVARFFTLMPKSPEFATIVVLLYYAFIRFNASRRTLTGVALGAGHALCHFVPFILAYILASLAAQGAGGVAAGSFAAFGVFMAVTFALSSLLGGLVFGAYLYVALNGFGMQFNNAFASLRIADYRSFIRIGIGDDGTLQLFPLKIRRSGRTRADGSWQPSSRPELIEPPVRIQ